MISARWAILATQGEVGEEKRLFPTFPCALLVLGPPLALSTAVHTRDKVKTLFKFEVFSSESFEVSQSWSARPRAASKAEKIWAKISGETSDISKDPPEERIL